MSLQSLVFCSDDKILRVLRRVLSDLEIRVEQCSDPESAILKLTRQRFEAVIVDCSDEQAAGQILKSARAAASNKRAVAVAIIDGEKAVKSAFQLGAHFVLYKPISMERAKGSFRAAHALMKRERRRNQRIAIEIPVVILGKEGGRQQGVTVDLGEGGMAVQVGRFSRNAQPLRVQLTLPGSGYQFDCSAEIAWENTNRQTGLRFIEMPSELRNQLKLWLERYSPEEIVKDDPPVGCKLTDLSGGGCYLETNTPFPIRAKVLLSMRMGESQLQVGGLVRIMHPDVGMGIEFTKTTRDESNLVARFIQVLQESGGASPELLVEPEGLETGEISGRTESGEDPLLDLFHEGMDLTPVAFRDQLHKQRASGGKSSSKPVPAFSV
jgi:DNA-binding response OmpR family regulator